MIFITPACRSEFCRSRRSPKLRHQPPRRNTLLDIPRHWTPAQGSDLGRGDTPGAARKLGGALSAVSCDTSAQPESILQNTWRSTTQRGNGPVPARMEMLPKPRFVALVALVAATRRSLLLCAGERCSHVRSAIAMRRQPGAQRRRAIGVTGAC